MTLNLEGGTGELCPPFSIPSREHRGRQRKEIRKYNQLVLFLPHSHTQLCLVYLVLINNKEIKRSFEAIWQETFNYTRTLQFLGGYSLLLLYLFFIQPCWREKYYRVVSYQSFLQFKLQIYYVNCWSSRCIHNSVTIYHVIIFFDLTRLYHFISNLIPSFECKHRNGKMEMEIKKTSVCYYVMESRHIFLLINHSGSRL